MPKLLVFAPCEKIILDQSGIASLIALFQRIDAQGTTPAIPENAVAPKEWAIFTLWEWLPEDSGKKFSQIVQILWPNQAEFQKLEIEFQAGNLRYHQNRVSIVGFPVGQVGDVKIRLWLERDSRKCTDTFTYCIEVAHPKIS